MQRHSSALMLCMLPSPLPVARARLAMVAFFVFFETLVHTLSCAGLRPYLLPFAAGNDCMVLLSCHIDQEAPESAMNVGHHR